MNAPNRPDRYNMRMVNKILTCSKSLSPVDGLCSSTIISEMHLIFQGLCFFHKSISNKTNWFSFLHIQVIRPQTRYSCSRFKNETKQNKQNNNNNRTKKQKQNQKTNKQTKTKQHKNNKNNKNKTKQKQNKTRQKQKRCVT